MSVDSGLGCYSILEAARLAEVNPRRARYLFTGSSQRGIEPVLVPSRDRVDGILALSFLDLIELKVAAAIKEQTGCSTQRLRTRYQTLKRKLQCRHPLANSRLLTDGRALVIERIDEYGEPCLADVDTGSRCIEGIIKPFLKELDYGADALARRWKIATGVTLNPEVHYGAPTLAEDGINTRIVAITYHANGDSEPITAWWLNISEEGVRDAVAFEDKYFRHAA